MNTARIQVGNQWDARVFQGPAGDVKVTITPDHYAVASHKVVGRLDHFVDMTLSDDHPLAQTLRELNKGLVDKQARIARLEEELKEAKHEITVVRRVAEKCPALQEAKVDDWSKRVMDNAIEAIAEYYGDKPAHLYGLNAYGWVKDLIGEAQKKDKTIAQLNARIVGLTTTNSDRALDADRYAIQAINIGGCEYRPNEATAPDLKNVVDKAGIGGVKKVAPIDKDLVTRWVNMLTYNPELRELIKEACTERDRLRERVRDLEAELKSAKESSKNGWDRAMEVSKIADGRVQECKQWESWCKERDERIKDMQAHIDRNRADLEEACGLRDRVIRAEEAVDQVKFSFDSERRDIMVEWSKDKDRAIRAEERVRDLEEVNARLRKLVDACGARKSRGNEEWNALEVKVKKLEAERVVLDDRARALRGKLKELAKMVDTSSKTATGAFVDNLRMDLLTYEVSTASTALLVALQTALDDYKTCRKGNGMGRGNALHDDVQEAIDSFVKALQVVKTENKALMVEPSKCVQHRPSEAHLMQALEWFKGKQWDKFMRDADKPGWHDENAVWLLARLKEEVAELVKALKGGNDADVAQECADVANFAFMIADLAHVHPANLRMACGPFKDVKHL